MFCKQIEQHHRIDTATDSRNDMLSRPDQSLFFDKLQKRHLSEAKNILIVQGTNDKTVYDPAWAKEIYNIVLETQVYVESIAKPGMYLNNKNFPEKSLNYLAHKFLESYGLGQYFAHNIGHFLGLDVHDVGDNNYELQPGDVFTIEPGIYIPEENLGIRIEDDFLMVEDGVVCLSFGLPKSCVEIEKLMKE